MPKSVTLNDLGQRNNTADARYLCGSLVELLVKDKIKSNINRNNYCLMGIML